MQRFFAVTIGAGALLIASHAAAADDYVTFTGTLGPGAPSEGSDVTGEPATVSFNFDPANLVMSSYDADDLHHIVYSTPDSETFGDYFLTASIVYAGQPDPKPPFLTQGSIDLSVENNTIVGYSVNFYETFDYGVGRGNYNEGIELMYDATSPDGGSAVVTDYLYHNVTDQYALTNLSPSTNISPGVPAAPEPSSWLLLTLGVGISGWYLRERRVRSSALV